MNPGITLYRRKTDQVLWSFNDPIPQVPILGTPLAQQQELSIQAIGANLEDLVGQPPENEPCFIFDDDLYFTPSFLRKALKIIETHKTNIRFCLAPNRFNQRYVLPYAKDPKDHLKFEFYYNHSKESSLTEVIVEQDIYDHYLQVQDQIVKGGSYFAGTSVTMIAKVLTPFHLLQINLAANLMRLAKREHKVPKWVRASIARDGSWLYYQGLKRMNSIGKQCQIHPTAVIEGSIIGDGVKVGAHAVIRFSQIGADTTIADNVGIINSVIGSNNTIYNSNFLVSVMTYDQVFMIHGPYQFSIFGRGVAAFAVINCDIRLDQESIKIPSPLGLLDTQQPLLGIAYGHHSKVGGGSIIAAGRIIPNGLHIVPNDQVITKFDQE